ncbi:MAG TPA: hypothetical protein VF855_09200 [Acidimicrobiales bacterium]
MSWQSGGLSFSYGKSTVSADSTALVIDGERFVLDEIDRMSLSASKSTSQGSWGKITASFMVTAGEQRGAVNFAGGQNGDDVEWWPYWEQLTGYGEAEIAPRIRTRIVTTLAQGGTVDVGGITKNSKGRYRLSAEGITPKRLFGKVLPWSSIAGMSVERTDWRFEVEKAPGKVARNSWLLGRVEWNAWVVPQLVAHYNGR